MPPRTVATARLLPSSSMAAGNGALVPAVAVGDDRPAGRDPHASCLPHAGHEPRLSKKKKNAKTSVPTPATSASTSRPARLTPPSVPATPSRGLPQHSLTPFAHPPVDTDSVVGGRGSAGSGVIADVGAAASCLPRGTTCPTSSLTWTPADPAAKSPHAWMRPASTLKTLTALTLLPGSTLVRSSSPARTPSRPPARASASSPATGTRSAASSTP